MLTLLQIMETKGQRVRKKTQAETEVDHELEETQCSKCIELHATLRTLRSSFCKSKQRNKEKLEEIRGLKLKIEELEMVSTSMLVFMNFVLFHVFSRKPSISLYITMIEITTIFC